MEYTVSKAERKTLGFRVMVDFFNDGLLDLSDLMMRVGIEPRKFISKGE